MQKASLVFTCSSNWMSKIIKFFDKAPISHVMVGHKFYDIPFVSHAIANGVMPQKRKFALAKRRIYKEFRIRQGVHLEHAMDAYGYPYDKAGILGFIPYWVGRHFKKKIRNPFASNGAMFCSEFALMLNHCGCIPEFEGLDPETTTPGDLLEICEASVLTPESSFELIEDNSAQL